VYVKRSRTGALIAIAVWVDDLWHFYDKRDATEFQELEGSVRALFPKMVKAVDVRSVLGMRVRRDRKRGTLTLDQQVYTESVLRRFGMEFCKPTDSPAVDKKLSKAQGPASEKEREEMKDTPYRDAVGSLIWLAGQTRPDIAFPVSVLTRFMSDPGAAHWTNAKRVLRYLKGTTRTKLQYGARRRGDTSTTANVCVLEAWSDADWAADVDGRKSMTGYVVLLNGNVIAWSSKKQPTVAMSTAEAEYMGMSAAAEELMWMRQFVTEIGMTYKRPIVLRTDNQTARVLATGEVSSTRTKHIDIRHHQIRDEIERGDVDVQWVPTEEQLADILTKCLPVDRFKQLRARLVIGYDDG
jgi:hypothetical protein